MKFKLDAAEFKLDAAEFWRNATWLQFRGIALVATRLQYNLSTFAPKLKKTTEWRLKS